MLLTAQSSTPAEMLAFAAWAGVIFGAAAAYLLGRWVYHLRGLQRAVASSFAPVDVQVMRCVDLLRQFLQHPAHEEVCRQNVGASLRKAHRRLRNASRRAAATPSGAQEMNELKQAIVELHQVFQPLLAQLVAQRNSAVTREIYREYNSAWQRLISAQAPFRDAVAQLNEAIDHPFGRIAAKLLRFETAEPLAELETNKIGR